MGVSTVEVFPQLAERFNLPVDHGAWIQELSDDGPAAGGDLQAGDDTEPFQARPYSVGGDVITQINGTPLTGDADLSELVARQRPGSVVRLVVYRDGKRRIVRLRLAERPAASASGG